jgi:hypothetical protein
MPYNVANIAGAVSQAEQDNQRANLSSLQIQKGQQDLQTAQFGQSQQEGLRAAMAAGHRPDGSFDTKAAMDVLSKSAPELIPKLQEQMGGQNQRVREEAITKMVTLGKLADQVVKANGGGYDQFLNMARQIAPDAQLSPTYDAQAMQAMAQQAASLGGKTTLKEGDSQLDVLGNVSTLAPPGIKAQTLAETMRHNRATEGLQSGAADQSDPNAPWRHVNDPKKRDEAKMRFGVAADARLAKEQEDVSKANNTITNLDRFIFLNKQNTTGARYAIPGSQAVAGALDPEVGEMKAIVDLMTPAMRQGMPGAASDRDVAMFRGATVGLNKPSKANENIATGLKIANQNIIDRAGFISQYVTQYGHDRGADAAWKKYINTNPIFDPLSPKGSYKLNPRRVSYSEWSGQSSMEAPPPQQPLTPLTPQQGGQPPARPPLSSFGGQ